MSFDVFLVAPKEEMPAEDAVHALTSAFQAIGAAQHGDEIQMRNGRWLEFYGGAEGNGGMFALRGLDRDVAEVVFTAADAMNCFIVPAGSSGVAFRTPGNAMAPPDDFLPEEVATGPDELLARLTGNHDDWAAYRDQVLQSPPPKRGFFSRLFGKS